MPPSSSSGPCFPIITNIFGDHVILMYKQLGLRDLKKCFSYQPCANPCITQFFQTLLSVVQCGGLSASRCPSSLCVVERPWNLPPGYFRAPLKPQIHGLSRRTFQKMEKLTRDRLWGTRRNEKRKPCLDIYL